MSTDSRAFLRELHTIIDELSPSFVDMLSAKKTIQNIPLLLEDEDINILKSISLTEQQADAIKKLAVSFGREVVFSLLCIIDGVADTKNEIPDLLIVNRQTMKEINEEFLHDEFVELTDE